MTQAKNVGKVTTATAKPKGARVRATKSDFALEKEPIGWHFKGKDEVPMRGSMFFLDESFLQFPCDRERRTIRKYKTLFWLTFIGMIAVYLSTLIK